MITIYLLLTVLVINDFCELTAWAFVFFQRIRWQLDPGTRIVLAATGQGLAGFNLGHHFRNAGRGHIHVIVVSWRNPTHHPSRPLCGRPSLRSHRSWHSSAVPRSCHRLLSGCVLKLMPNRKSMANPKVPRYPCSMGSMGIHTLIHVC